MTRASPAKPLRAPPPDRWMLQMEIDPDRAVAGPPGAAVPERALELALLDAVPGVVVLVTEAGQVRWISSSVEAVTGHRPSDLVGSDMFEYMDLEWNPRTLESIGFAVVHPGPRLPTLIRFLKKDGTGIILEVTANNLFDHDGINALVVHMHDCSEQQRLEEMLEAMAEGADSASVIRMLHEVAAAETLRADSAVVLLSPELADEGAVLTSSAEVRDLTTSADPDSPWDRAAVTGEPLLLTDLDELPDLLRAAAVARGYRACWAYPVRRLPAGDVAAVIVLWRREDGPPEPNASMVAERLTRLMALMIERFEHIGQLEYAAGHDSLTGLANRDRLFEHIEEQRARRDGLVGVLYLDLDGFKPVNDRFGHGAGDWLLMAVADRLRACVRDEDLVARVGGDEFAVSCPGASVAELVTIAERILATVPEPVALGEIRVAVGTTIGLASAHASECTSDLLVAAADAALVSAKAEAKGTWRTGVLPERP